MRCVGRPLRPAWVVLGGLAVCAAAKLVHVDEDNLGLILATGVTPVLYLPAEVLLVVAVVRRERALAVVSLVLVLLHVTWVVGPLTRSGAEDQHQSERGARLTVLEANLFHRAAVPQSMRRLLDTERPDVVVLLEVTPQSLGPFLADPVAVDYPYRSLQLTGSVQGVAVLSRLPLLDTSVHTLDEVWPFVDTTVLCGAERVRLLTAHVVSPVGNRGQWRRQLRWVATQAAARGEGPLVIAGDFNATPYHHALAVIEARGRLTDALQQAGSRWPMTWPQMRHLPPLLGLDHVLVSPDIVVEAAHTVALDASDHRGVVATVSLPRSPAT